MSTIAASQEGIVKGRQHYRHTLWELSTQKGNVIHKQVKVSQIVIEHGLCHFNPHHRFTSAIAHIATQSHATCQRVHADTTFVQKPDWAGLGWAWLSWAGLGWAELGWAGLSWAGLG